MSRSESHTQPGWAWAPLHRVRALEEARLGPQDPAGRQGAVTKHQDSVQSWGQRACQLPRLSSSPGTSLWGRGREWEEGLSSLPWDPPILLETSRNPLPHRPQQPLVGAEERGEVITASGSGPWILARTPTLQGTTHKHSSSFLTPPMGLVHPSLPVTTPHWVSRPDTHLSFPNTPNVSPILCTWQKQRVGLHHSTGLAPRKMGAVERGRTCGEPSLYQ